MVAEEIIDKIKAGKDEYFREVIQEYQQQIFKYNYFMLGRAEDAEDATQEVFLKAYQNIISYRKSTSFTSWLYAIAHNHCVNLLRRRNLIKFLPLKLNIFKDNNDVEREIENIELSESLHEAMKELSSVERSLVLLRIFENKKYKEIAEILHIKPVTLRKKYERARKKLKKYLFEVGELVEDEYCI